MHHTKSRNFFFSKGIDPVIESISAAKDFLKIVSFQLTSPRIVGAIEDACKRGVRVSVITLPPDSYAGDSTEIEVLFDNLCSYGVDLSLCSWEVGEPRLTTTSLSGTKEGGMGQKWYALHAKFLVTEHNAQISSSNCADEHRLECYLNLYDDDSIDEFVGKFQYLKEMFIDTKEPPIPGAFITYLPPDLQEEVRSRHSHEGRLIVKQYPQTLCPTGLLRPGLTISPFQGRARDVISEMIQTAERFLFLSSERFFDEDLTEQLLARIRAKPLNVKILAGPPQDVRQSPGKARSMIENLIAAGCEYAFPPNIHAKLWVSDKWFSIGSVNLTKMNLGFYPQGNQYRADTQVLYMQDDASLIERAATSYDEWFQSSPQGITVLSAVANKIQRARHTFRSQGLKCTSNAAALVSRLESYFAIEAVKKTNEIFRLATILVKKHDGRKVEEKHVAMAVILLLLKERRHSEDDILSKLAKVISSDLIRTALVELDIYDYITKEVDGWAINIAVLIDEQPCP